MDNLDDSETNAKVSDSAYSYSCSNSQSRKSHSSKSTHSGSNSSGSSGYGGKQSTSVSSATLNQLPEKRTKDKDGKKKKQAQTEIKTQAVVEFRLPDPAPINEPVEKPHNAAPPPSPKNTPSHKGSQRSMDTTVDKIEVDPVISNIPQSPILATSKSSNLDGLACVISMDEGVVLYMSASFTTTLGFPKDMWIGRSFIDFVHPLDRTTFASQITSGLAVPQKVNGMQNAVQSPGNSVSTMFCRIRKYKDLSFGFRVKDQAASFMPFMLKLIFKDVCDEKALVIYLVIHATPLVSVFRAPNEIVVNATSFVMRHVANGNLEYIDNEGVPYLGYLPQDITGRDVLKLYHPEDLTYMMHVYETIVKQGRMARSKPYRIMAQNGYYMKLETEWTSFINPWSRKLEFVIGKNYVIEGPDNPDVFLSPPKKGKNLKDDADVEDLKNKIVKILNDVPTKPADLAKLQMVKRCQNLAAFMERLIEDGPKGEEELRLQIQEIDNSYYERDSVMLGGLSPHHEYNDSESSTETSLSYNQLNFNINLKRYFDSHEVAYHDDVIKAIEAASMKRQTDLSRNTSPMADDSPKTTPEPSASMHTEARSSHCAELHKYQSIRLTESLLSKHNVEMEKILVKKHRENRPSTKENMEKMCNDSNMKKKDHLGRCNAPFVPPPLLNAAIPDTQPHGIKRAKQLEQEAGTHKQQCTSPGHLHRRVNSSSPPQHPSATFASASTSASMCPQNFANGMAPNVSQQMPLMSPIPALPSFVPMYYVPSTPGSAVPCTSEMTAPATSTTTTPTFQTPALQYMMYGQAVFGTPVMVSSFPVQQNVMQNYYANVQNNLSLDTRNYEEACKPVLPSKPLVNSKQLAAWRERRRAALSAALSSSKGDGANTGSSISSASNDLNRSNEAVPDRSVCQDSNMKSEETVCRTNGGSSYSSFNSSFFKTESGSAEDSGDAKKTQNKSEDGATCNFSDKDSARNKQMQKRKMEPPWMEQVCVTSELIYKYQLLTKNLDEVLISDKKKMDGMEQPSLVNEQLGQLYMDMELEGVAERLTLEEGITSSSSSGEDNLKKSHLTKRTQKKRNYSKLVMIYEEDAPLPPPDDEPEPTPSTS